MVASQYLKTLQRCFVHEQKSLSPEQEVVLTKFFRAALPLSSYTFVNQEFTVGGLPCAKKLTPKIVPACMRRINETRPRVGERYPVTLNISLYTDGAWSSIVVTCITRLCIHCLCLFTTAADVLVYYSNGLLCLFPLLQLSGCLCHHILLPLHYITSTYIHVLNIMHS